MNILDLKFVVYFLYLCKFIVQKESIPIHMSIKERRLFRGCVQYVVFCYEYDKYSHKRTPKYGPQVQCCTSTLPT